MSNFLQKCEKKNLCDYNINDELFDKLELNVEDIIPLRNAFHIKSKEGEYILKKIDMSIERLEFIDRSLSFCRKKCKEIMSYKKNKEEKIYYEYKNDKYVLVEVFKGRESVYTDIQNVLIATKTIANFHKSSEGIHEYFNKKINPDFIINKLKNKIDDLEKIDNILCEKKYKTEFDNIFIENRNKIKCYCYESINMIDNIALIEIYENRNKLVLCHHDLAHHNVLISEEKGFLIDFDYAIIDTKIHDICNFINKVVKEFFYDINIVDMILREYYKTNELTIGELKILYALLIFPNDIMSLFRDYYNKSKQWSDESFVSKINRKLININERIAYTEELRERI